MLSSNFYNLFKYHLQYAAWFISIPYSWDPVHKALHVTRAHYLRFIIFSLDIHLYLVYLLTQVFYQKFYVKVDSNSIQFYFLYGMCSCCMLFFVVTTQLLRKPHTVAQYITAWFKFLETVRGKVISTFKHDLFYICQYHKII